MDSDVAKYEKIPDRLISLIRYLLYLNLLCAERFKSFSYEIC